MNKEFDQYIGARCDNTVIKDETYKKLQTELSKARKNNDIDIFSEISGLIEVRVQEFCYMQGFRDAMQIMMNMK